MPAWFEKLEDRMFLSVASMHFNEASILTRTPAKKAPPSPGEKTKKPKKSPEITLLVGSSIVPDNTGTVDFGVVVTGNAGPTRTFLIRNDGTAKLDIKDLVVPAGFSLLDAPAGRLNAGDSTRFTVRLNVNVVANRLGQITFTTNDADEKQFNFTVRGRVIAPPPPPPPVRPPKPPVNTSPLISVRLVRPGRSSLALADGATEPIEFAPAIVGAPAPTRTFRITNEGTAPLGLGAIQLPAGFKLVEGLAASLAPGKMDEFTVAMETSAVASRRGEIRFATTDARAPIFNFAISGTVVAPAPKPAAGLSGTTLTIEGTAGDDAIIVTGRRGALNVTINGKALAGSPFAGITKIVVNANLGNDRVDFSGLFVNSTANGGPGSDTLVGGASDDVLNGESGDDLLDGGAGSDHLAGGDGNDTLIGGDGVDVFNGDAGNDTLQAIDGITDSLLDPGSGTDIVRKDRVDMLTQ